MNSLAGILAVSGATLLLGVVFIVRSVRRERWRRRVLSWVGVVLGTGLLGVSAVLGYVAYTERHTLGGPHRPTAEELARPVEPFGYRLLEDGSEASLAAHRGDVVLVNLWATWCAPCLQEMPYLERLQEVYDTAGFAVITLTREPADVARTMAHRLPSNAVNAYVPDLGALPEPFPRGFRVLPTSYVIGRDGYIREFWMASRDYDELEAMIVPHL